MSSFRPGKFTRTRAPGLLRQFVPDHAYHSIFDVAPSALVADGVKLVLMDVDNTLLPWRSEEIPEDTQKWIKAGRDLGLEFCLVSNTRNPSRLQRLATAMGVDLVDGKFKPSREMFLRALQRHKVEPRQAVMIGDQLLTDILGANRSGISTIWVQRMSEKEFLGTRANRFIEKLITPGIYRALQEEEDDLPIVKPEGIFQSRIVRQIFKFCIVGGSSFIIDAGLHRILMFNLHLGNQLMSQRVGGFLYSSLNGGKSPTEWQAHNAAFTAFKIVSAGLAILNSFYWNRRWTFGIKSSEDQASQLVKFLVVSLIGMGLNIVIASGLNHLGKGSQEGNWWFATLVAAALVAVWNFTGQRLWAFRKGRAA
ncbi:MAG: YqeG family HAD IIIA-type phosphatase [Armatimonadetes bacterium]|nr:YqeG family HAD IIIA-type phosphatase [Armatimonadota bacterium]